MRIDTANWKHRLIILALTAAVGLAVLWSMAGAWPVFGQSTEDAAPAKPTGLTGTVSSDAVSLSWDDPGDSSITGYQVLRRNPAVDAKGVFQTVSDDDGYSETLTSNATDTLLVTQQQQDANVLDHARPGTPSDPLPGGPAWGRSHNGLHDAAKDITLDFSSTTSALNTNLTGSGNYDISGIHMDADYVYLALRGTVKGIFKFDRSDGSIVKKKTVSYTPQGLAGTSSNLYTHNAGGGIEVYTLALVDGTDIVVSTTGNIQEVYSVGDAITADTTFNLTFLSKTRAGCPEGTREDPSLRSKRLSGGSSVDIYVNGTELEPAGVTLDNIEGLDSATDGTTMFIEDGSGGRALGFTTTSVRIWFKDVQFGGNNYDGLFFDGTNLWSVDVDSLSPSNETMVLRAFTPGAGPTTTVAATVSESDLEPALMHEVALSQSAIEFPPSQDVMDEYPSGTPAVFDAASYMLAYYEQSVFPNPLLIAQDDGPPARMWSMEGVPPQGILGDLTYLWVVDNRTKGVYALDRAAFDAVELRLSHPFLVADDFYFETPPESLAGTG